MRSLGFKQSGADSCVFIRATKGKKVEVIAVCVDDLMLLAETSEGMQQIEKSLSDAFKMKVMGELHYCLGVNIHIDDNGIVLCKRQYLLRLLGSRC